MGNLLCMGLFLKFRVMPFPRALLDRADDACLLNRETRSGQPVPAMRKQPLPNARRRVPGCTDGQ